MTRINCVPPSELDSRHLLAEYRELPRVFRLARKAAARGVDPADLPRTYRLGPGHVEFFYDKLVWLVRRQQSIIEELSVRGYRVSEQFARPELLVGTMHRRWLNDWEPRTFDKSTNRIRLAERLATMKEQT